MEKNQKISESLKAYYTKNVHHNKGKPGRKPSEAEKINLSEKLKAHHDKKGRVTEKHKKARNKANVYAWRARKYNAIVESSDLQLIKLIYENCPDGYHVDHIIPLAKGGLHHQDNLQYLEANENCRKGATTSFDKSKAIDWRELVIGV